MSTFINIDLDAEQCMLIVYVSSNDCLENIDQYTQEFHWDPDNADEEFGIELDEAERYARRLTRKMEAEIRKNYGEIT